jgi:hypothetical protein
VSLPFSFDSGKQGPCYLVFAVTIEVNESPRHLTALLTTVVAEWWVKEFIKRAATTKIRSSCSLSVSYLKGYCY